MVSCYMLNRYEEPKDFDIFVNLEHPDNSSSMDHARVTELPFQLFSFHTIVHLQIYLVGVLKS